VHRFQSRINREAALVKLQPRTGLVEAVFGAFPRQQDTDYLVKKYKDVFTPIEVDPSPETWLQVFKKGAGTPLQVTRHGLDIQRHGYHELLVYVFEPI
jgi:hypothetical protein